MNAEFLEKDIVIRFDTNKMGEQIYFADKVRKNLAPISFIGATAVTEDGTQAYRIKFAKLVISGTIPTVYMLAGPYRLGYLPLAGTFLDTRLD